MRRLILIMICALIALSASPSSAVEFHNDKTPVLGWQAVTTDVDGDPLTGTVTYKLWIVNANTDPNKTNPVEVTDEDGDDTNLVANLTLIKGRYFIGVQAHHATEESVINWGDIIDNQENVTLFGLRWAVSPKPPKQLTD